MSRKINIHEINSVLYTSKSPDTTKRIVFIHNSMKINNSVIALTIFAWYLKIVLVIIYHKVTSRL